MIHFNDISKSYGTQVIFDSVSFSVNPGERIGLTGRNGSGKTTLFRLILGQEHPDNGTIRIPSDYSIGHLSQHIAFTEQTVLQEACRNLKPSEDGVDETYKAASILLGLGFSKDDYLSAPERISGGYQVRLNLAKVLISEPSLLLLDEPTNYLDIVSIRWLSQFLRSWKDELILITHDRDFMNSVTTHTMGIHRTKIRKTDGSTDKLTGQLLLEEEVYEKTRINDERKRKEVEQFINRFRAQANKARAVQSRIKSLQKKERLEKLSDEQDLDFSFKSATFTGKKLLASDNVAFSFDKTSPLIDSLSFEVGKKDRIAIIGKNGRGKTTLLNLLADEIKPDRGDVYHHPQLRLAYFGQTNINRLNLENTIEQEIMDVHPDNSRGAARNICGAMMFEGDNALKRISVLSGGERSRVLLGKLLVTPANLLLLDEPTNHLDMESIDSLLEAIDEFRGAVIIVTHSEMILNAVAERLIVFDGGRVFLFEGTYQDFLDRIGWSDEKITDNENKQPQTALSKAPNRRDLRRLRAEILTERSKKVGVLQKEITMIEDRISTLEARVERDTEGLLAASHKSDGNTIRSLSKSIHSAKEEIESLFERLILLTEELKVCSAEFDQRLESITPETSAQDNS